MDRWENDLATRDTNRVTRPFEWGFDWVPAPVDNSVAEDRLMDRFVRQAVAGSGDFFRHSTPSDFALDDSGELTFSSPAGCKYPENQIARARYFRASGNRGRAVVVLPQWNADAGGHVGLCKLLNRFGISALRLTLAYHDVRRPAGLERAEFHVSSNVGRTIHAVRQSSSDARACLDWLQAQGYLRLGIVGTSLGSCVAFLTAAHDERIAAGVFNHVSMNFADVVWTGLSTRHVRESLARHLSLDQLRHYWSVISPETYMDRFENRQLRSLLVWARYDTTFLPELSRKVLAAFAARRLDHEVFELPCGHYTTGKFPFNWMDGLAICSYLSRKL